MKGDIDYRVRLSMDDWTSEDKNNLSYQDNYGEKYNLRISNPFVCDICGEPIENGTTAQLRTVWEAGEEVYNGAWHVGCYDEFNKYHESSTEPL